MESLYILWIWAIIPIRLCRRFIFYSSNLYFSFLYYANNLSTVRLPDFSFLMWCVSTLLFSFFLLYPLIGCKIGLWLSFSSSLYYIIYFVCWVLSFFLNSYRSSLSFALPTITYRHFCIYSTRCISNLHIAFLRLKRYCDRLRINLKVSMRLIGIYHQVLKQILSLGTCASLFNKWS